ncbi:sugar O-acetyltransferase [Halpernia frigidisoli]|uniref:Acetyltransferase n=1 Tax=Halpernia frigidisoli TaxID=1125876 RepID=A0A1I3F4Z7_9FLAO|nr:sugar O-acetyltransferase [Halpernia frigidisoli]SFI06277.1 maltose O-acetyltransferase [Halpernia frigidisoli]
MKSEKEKMLSGEPYLPVGKELFLERQKAKEKIFEFNNLSPLKIKERHELIKPLFGKTKGTFYLEPPFRCDYGFNIEIGKNFYANYNFLVLDAAKVKIGDHVMIGPNVSLITVNHPIDKDFRKEGYEISKEIVIEDNVWICANVNVNPGVTIGANSIIGSGSVVTKNIPENVIAAGNPCKVLREITEKDRTDFQETLK